MKNFGEVLETTRRAGGMTQAQLAAATGVTQVAVHRYEKESRAPSPEVVARLARALGVTSAFFAHAGRVEGAMAVDAHMRRQQTAGPTVWRRLEARLNVLRMHAGLLYEDVSLSTSRRFPTFDPIDTGPADAARLVRMQWRMPAGPVRNLVGWLESAGCLVLEENFETQRVDGMSQWAADHPVILLNAGAPVDRKRWTLAHELGHLVLHTFDVSLDVEQEANSFAAEFLMPAETIRYQLHNLTIGRSLDLKREWGTSIQALVGRAHELDVISPSARAALHKQLSARGWRTREPVSDELTPEVPELPQDIARAVKERGLTDDDLARLAGFSDAARNSLFVLPERPLRAVR